MTQLRAGAIADKLSGQAEAVARHLLPNGKRAGREWKCGGTDGEAGKSLSVCLEGGKAGVWSDFSTGESGDLLDLWAATRNLSMRDAITEAMSYLGVRPDRMPDRPTRQFKKPTRDGVGDLSDEHTAWLRDVRKLPDASVAAYKLRTRRPEPGAHGDDRLMFPYLRGDKLVFAKYRRKPATLPKTQQFSAEADCEPILFGWQAISPGARAVIICEGELDAIAWHAYGWPALSAPTGAGSCKWIEAEYEHLAIFDKIFLSYDMDDAGRAGLDEVIRRLGTERCRIVELPLKDANECLMEGISHNAMAVAIRDAKTRDPEELQPADAFTDAVWEEFNKVDAGIRLPWPKTESGILLRPGEVSLWAGVNGHGKSEVVGFVTAHAVFNQDVKTCVASMEFAPAKWLRRMYRQVAGLANPTEEYIRHIGRQTDDFMWVFDATGTAKATRVIEVFGYAVRRYGIKFFVIDNLAKLGLNEDDYNGQKALVDALTDFARTHNAHVVLVHHMRKGEDEDRPAGKMRVKGTGAITDMVDTVIEVFRNKKREKLIAKLQRDHEPVPDELLESPGTMLLVHKQRNGESEPTILLWFDPASHQFLAQHGHVAQPLVDYRRPTQEAA
jgi:twinkle protein